jgi:hypothetical protein
MSKVALLSLLLTLLLVSGYGYGQKYITKNGNIKFEASATSFEEVKAIDDKVSAVLEIVNDDLVVLLYIKDFHFKSALMEEHFNENYMESEKFPKATFVGKVEGFSISDVTSATKKYNVSGDLTLHGKTKRVSATAAISRSSDGISLVGSFEVKPEDYGITIPKILWNKIAERVSIKYVLILTKQ